MLLFSVSFYSNQLDLISKDWLFAVAAERNVIRTTQLVNSLKMQKVYGKRSYSSLQMMKSEQFKLSLAKEGRDFELNRAKFL